MKKLNIDEIHNATIPVLQKFHEICEELGVRYFLAYGTLLGAIRHNGFIPWDDDADVWVPRDDYNRLIKYLLDNSNEVLPYKICTRKNTKNYYYGMARFANSEYKYKTIGVEKQADIGVFIDIYPLDDYGDDMNECKKVYSKTKKINKLYSAYINPKGRNLFLSIVRPLLFVYTHIVWGKNYCNKIDKTIEEIIYKNNQNRNKKYVGIPAWTNAKIPQIFDRHLFDERVIHKFESIELFIPKEWDKLLKICYNDYMELPPEEERVSYHSYEIYVE